MGDRGSLVHGGSGGRGNNGSGRGSGSGSGGWRSLEGVRREERGAGGAAREGYRRGMEQEREREREREDLWVVIGGRRVCDTLSGLPTASTAHTWGRMKEWVEGEVGEELGEEGEQAELGLGRERRARQGGRGRGGGRGGEREQHSQEGYAEERMGGQDEYEERERGEEEVEEGERERRKEVKGGRRIRLAIAVEDTGMGECTG
ncbi:unnamed protein product [Closterium sp. NIES-54]